MERKLTDYTGPVVDALRAGIIPWSMRYLPRNVLTGGVYRGMNPLLLHVAATRHGFSSPLWGSRKDWKTVGSKLTEPAKAGTRVWTFEDLVYYPRTKEDIAYNWDQTDHSFKPSALTLGNASEVIARIMEKVGADLPSRAVTQTGPGSMADYAAVAHDLMDWKVCRMPTHDGNRIHSTSLLRALRAEMGAGYLLGAFGVEPLPPHLGCHRPIDSRWAELLRTRPDVLPDLCKLVTSRLHRLLKRAGVTIPWHFFKVKVTRWSLPRGDHRPSVYAVRADDKVLGDVWRDAGGFWKAGETEARHSRNYNTKEDALAALLARHGIDPRTPVVDNANVVSVPVSFGPWAGERVFDYDSAFYLGGEDGVYFLPHKGSEGKWHAFVIVSTDWGESVLALDGPHDRYVEACEAGIRLAHGWLSPRKIRVAEEDIEAIREEAGSRSAAL